MLRALTICAFLAVLGDVELVERPRIGRVLVTEVASRSTATLVSSKNFVDGEEVPLPGKLTRTIELEQQVAFRDELTTVVGERVEGFTRTFTTTSRTSSMQMVDPHGVEHGNVSERHSRYRDVPLRFQREGDRFLALDGEGAPLEGLLATPDWGELLPEETPTLGGQWSVDADWLESLREPGGELEWRASGDPAQDLELVVPAGSTEYEGRIRATLAAVEQGIARIELRIEVETCLDLTPFLPKSETEEHGDGPHRPTIVSSKVVAEVRGVGKVSWNLAEGRPDALVLELESNEVETVDFGHTRFAPRPGFRTGHDVELVSVSESTIAERIEVALRED